MTKRIIEGKAYNTATATIVATMQGAMKSDRPQVQNIDWFQALYLSKSGTFFIFQTITNKSQGTNIESINTITSEDAKNFLSCDKVLVLDKSVFDIVTRDGSDLKEETFLLRLPSHLKNRAVKLAKSQKLSFNAFITRLIEEYLMLNHD
jgi:hypothetical protein